LKFVLSLKLLKNLVRWWYTLSDVLNNDLFIFSENKSVPRCCSDTWELLLLVVLDMVPRGK
jgi:hypothetical protein